MRTNRPLVAAAALLALAAPATTLIALDLPSLTSRSAVVARGTVRSVDARWTRDGARIMTDAVIEVAEAWKGTPGRLVTVMQPGGVVGDVGQLVHGTARFAAGEDVVVFLEPRGDRYLLTGMLQGKFRVETSSDGRAAYARQDLEGEAAFVDPATRQPVSSPALVLPLAALRAEVLAAGGASAPVEPSGAGPLKVTP